MNHLIDFKEKLLAAFRSSNKTSWGKNEVINRILTEYVLFVEDILKTPIRPEEILEHASLEE